MKKISQYDKKVIAQLYQKGVSISEIAKIYGVCKHTIKYHLKRIGFDTQDPFPISGKTYDDYIEDEQARKREKQARCCHDSITVIIKCKKCGKTHTFDYETFSHLEFFHSEFVK